MTYPTNATELINDARDALATLNALTTHTDDCDRDSHAPSDAHDIASYALRNALCCLEHDDDAIDETLLTLHRTFYTFDPADARDDAERAEHDLMPTIFDLLDRIIAAPFMRDSLTDLALADSLCPLHFCDYAICFDDDDDACRTIRLIHPSHDT